MNNYKFIFRSICYIKAFFYLKVKSINWYIFCKVAIDIYLKNNSILKETL